MGTFLLYGCLAGFQLRIYLTFDGVRGRLRARGRVSQQRPWRHISDPSLVLDRTTIIYSFWDVPTTKMYFYSFWMYQPLKFTPF